MEPSGGQAPSCSGDSRWGPTIASAFIISPHRVFIQVQWMEPSGGQADRDMSRWQGELLPPASRFYFSFYFTSSPSRLTLFTLTCLDRSRLARRSHRLQPRSAPTSNSSHLASMAGREGGREGGRDLGREGGREEGREGASVGRTPPY